MFKYSEKRDDLNKNYALFLVHIIALLFTFSTLSHASNIVEPESTFPTISGEIRTTMTTGNETLMEGLAVKALAMRSSQTAIDQLIRGVPIVVQKSSSQAKLSCHTFQEPGDAL